MLNNSTATQKPWLKVSHSSDNTFSYCNRKFEFNKIYLDGKVRPGDESIPAEVGKAFHEAYQEYIRTGDLQAAQWTLLRRYPWHLDLFESNNRRSWDVALSTFNEACQRFDFGEYDLVYVKNPDTGEEMPCVEIPFELRFLNTETEDYAGFAWVGYIDLIMRSRFNASIRTFDIKTHMSRLQNREAEYRFNTQQLPYGIVVEHLLGKRIESFDVTYLDCFLDLAEPRVNEYTYTKDQLAIEEWLTARILRFRSMKNMLELKQFPRRENGCVAFNYPCRYMDICMNRNHDNIRAWFADVPDASPDQQMQPLVVAEIDLGEGIL